MEAKLGIPLSSLFSKDGLFELEGMVSRGISTIGLFLGADQTIRRWSGLEVVLDLEVMPTNPLVHWVASISFRMTRKTNAPRTFYILASCLGVGL